MIRVNLKAGSKELSVTAEGHALFDKKGKDIVCASVSVLIQSWHIGTRELCRAEVDVQEKAGYFSAKVGNYGEKEKLLFDSLALSLNFLERQFGQNIKVTVEEDNGRC